MEKKLVPELRFPEFSGEWEVKSLGEMLDERNDQIPENEEYPLMSFVQGIGVTPKSARYDRSFLVRDEQKKYKKTEWDDFIYSSNNLETGSIGLNKTGKAVISPVYSIFSSKNELESQFIGIMAHRKGFIAKMIRYRQGVVYGQWRIHESEFLNIKVRVPSHEEQKKIIEFFSDIDNLIIFEQIKLEIIENYKRGMMQKLFPKKGESVPELRFKGFTEPWEQRELRELTSLITKGTTPLDKSGNGKINFIKIENIDPSSCEIITTAKITKEEHDGYLKRSKLQENDILFSIAGTLGRVTTVKKDVLPANTNQALAIIRLNNGCLNYISTFLKGNAVSEYIKKNPTVGAQPNLSLEQVGSLEISLPKEEEQRQIGEFFIHLDNLITLHRSKLEELKELKKGFVQKMFI